MSLIARDFRQGRKTRFAPEVLSSFVGLTILSFVMRSVETLGYFLFKKNASI
jgi:hypothetical protein